MAKIRNTQVYNYDTSVKRDDSLVGTNSEDGVTKNYRVGDVLDLANQVYYISDDIIPSYTPVAVINNLAYKLDPSNPQHQFAFYGFSTSGASIGDLLRIQVGGEIELQGWGLIQGKHYLAGINGSLITINNTTNFSKIVGYAITSNRLRIIKDSITINKI